MGYYNISLTGVAKDVCTITPPFVKYEYNRLPMGVSIASDSFQDQMITLMDNLEFFIVYLDDYFIIKSDSFEEHLAKVKEVMK